MRILITDDSLTMRRAIRSILSMGGYTDVIEACNGQEALDRLYGIDVVLMDWNMPVMNGLTAVKAIRADTKFCDIPIIMVTTEGARETVIDAMRNGVSDFVIKPVDPKVLLDKIRSLTAHQETADVAVGQRSFILTSEVHGIINTLADKLDAEGIESRNASKLIRYCVLQLCPDTSDKSLKKAVEQIRKDARWSKA